MTAGLRGSFLRACSTAILIVALAWLAGGQALLGRIDPALAVPLLAPPMLLLARWQRRDPASVRRRSVLLALGATAAVQAAFAYALAGSAAAQQLLPVALAGGVAALVADALVRWRPPVRALSWLAALLFVSAWFGAGHLLLAWLYRPAVASAAPAAPAAPAATMLTGLPLRWQGGDSLASMIAGGAKDDPALARLAALGPTRLVDSLTDDPPPPGGTLFIAHPRALAPQELVAIDAFVRGGGRAVILADALSGWPPRHPLGDPRNPPVTSLLTPLLDHWGVTLGAAPVDEEAAIAADVEHRRLRLSSAGRFDRLRPTCRTFADDHVAHCRIGSGEAWLVGDADLFHASLWRPLVPGADHLRQADTMEWIAARLWPGAGQATLHPIWIRPRAG